MSHAVLALIIAPFIGSFLGVLIARLPAGDDLVTSRSRCPACGHALGPRDLVPLLSFIVLRGRCRHCGTAIAAFNWQVELAALAVAVGAVAVEGVVDGDPLAIWADCVLGWTLLALAWIDLRTLLLPDVLTLPLLLLGLGWTAWSAPDELADHAAAALAGWFALEVVAMLYRRLRGFDGLGAGDAKLLGAGGAWVGLALMPWLVVLAATVTLLGTVVLAWRRGFDGATPLPFGPGLAVAIWVFQFVGAAG